LVFNWPVATGSVKALSADLFHRQAEDAGLSRAEALRQAMRALMIDGAGSNRRRGAVGVLLRPPDILGAIFARGRRGGVERLPANEYRYAIPWLSVYLIGKLALTPDLK